MPSPDPWPVPGTLLLGRHDDTGRLRSTGRTVPLTRTMTAALADALTSTVSRHPCAGQTLTAGGAAVTSWTSRSSTRSWWWKSPWTAALLPRVRRGCGRGGADKDPGGDLQ